MSGVVKAASNRHYVLFLLSLAYALSILDRYAMGILAEPIKRDLGLSDTMLGLLTGMAFGLFYSTLAVPVARLADRGNRRNLIAASIFAWSLCTVACGYAANAVQLALARVGVGVGEAGSSPPAQSLIGDLFPEHERGRAVGLFTSGSNLGVFLALGAGGLAAAAWGWRATFIVLGLPGILLAAVVIWTMREPERGRSEGEPAKDQANAPAPSLMDAVRLILSHRALLLMILAAVLSSMSTNALLLWLPAYLIRAFFLDAGQVGPALAILFGGLGFCGAIAVGWISDRVSKGDLKGRLLLAASIPALVWPCLIGALLAPAYPMALALLVIPGLVCTAPTALTWTTMLSIAPSRMRATVAALAVLVANIGGLVIAPTLVGGISDLAATDDPAAGLRTALLLFSLVLVASTALFLLSHRSLRLAR